MSDYAYLNEVWSSVGGGKVKKPSDPSCEGGLDDIMNAYIGKSQSCDQPSGSNACAENTGNVTKPKSAYEPEGYNLDNNYYPLTQYYGEGLKAMPPAPKATAPMVATIPQETLEEVPSKDDIYKNIIEKYSNRQNGTATPEKYIELVIYLISGFFLIFMMEQILQIGRSLHR